MAQTLWLLRHAQASFGAADYDNLSELGHAQSRALGVALKKLGCAPDAVCLGAMKRHRQTFDGANEALGLPHSPTIIEGLNEFDFTGLLNARFPNGAGPEGIHDDRRAHFTALRDTVLEWQRGEIDNPPESFESFSTRVTGALEHIRQTGAENILAVSSGGPIGFIVGHVMGAPADSMIRLQLQVKNASLTRLILTGRTVHLSTFNETPHITAENAGEMMTYS